MAITLIQTITGNAGSYANTNVQTLPAGVTAGSLLVLGIVAGSNDIINLVTDNRGNVYALANAVDTNERGLWLYYARNAAAGATTVTVTFGAGAYPDSILFIREYGGLDTANPFDVTAIGSNTTTYLGAHTTAASAATAQANELVVVLGGSADSQDPTFSAGSGYGNFVAARGFDIYSYGLLEDKTVSATGSQTGTYNSVRFVIGGAILATFKAAASGTSVTTTPAVQTATLSQPAPSLTTQRQSTVAAAVQGLILSQLNPAIVGQRQATLTPQPQTATLTTVAPIISAAQNGVVSPASQSAILAQIAPTVTTTRSATALPSPQDAVFSLPAVAVNTVRNLAVSPTSQLASFVQLTATVSVVRQVAITPLVQTISLTQAVPTVGSNGNANVAAPTLALTTAPLVPVVTTSQATTVNVPFISLTSAILLPLVSSNTNVTTSPATPEIRAEQLGASIFAEQNRSITVGAAPVSWQQISPTVSGTTAATVAALSQTLDISSLALVIRGGAQIAVSLVGLSSGGLSPSISANRNVAPAPTTQGLVWTALPQAVIISTSGVGRDNQRARGFIRRSNPENLRNRR